MLRHRLIRLRALFRREALESEFEEELQYHLEREIERNRARGMDLEGAQRAARRALGDPGVIKEEARGAWTWNRLEEVVQDLRYSLRQLVRGPAFAVAAIATLGLGIGATTAIFSVVDGLLLRSPAGVSDFDRVVSVYTSDYSGPPYGSSSLPDLRDFETGASTLSGVAAYAIAPVVLSGDGSAPAEMVLGQVVTPNYFEVLGVRPAAGRAFTAGEGTPGGRGDVVVLGHELWRARFGADVDIVGETVRLAGAPYTVIGIAPEDFRGLVPALTPGFFVPVGAPGISDARVEERGSRGFFSFARLAEGATIDQARVELQAIAARLHEQYPSAWSDVRSQPRAVTLIAARQATVPPQLRGPAFGFATLLIAIVGGVLLIACANVANLLLVRATGRRREMGIRLAIGASRRRVVRQLLTESMVLAALGAWVGLVIAFFGTRALALFATRLPLPFPVQLDMAPNLRVFAFAAALTVVAGTLSGLAPAIVTTRKSLSSSLQREEVGSRRFGLRAALAAGQIAVAMLLLTAGGLLIRSLLFAQSADPGFQTTGLLSIGLALDEQSSSAEERFGLQNDLLERLRALPGASSASYASSLPLSAGEGRRTYRPEGYSPTEAEDMEINTSNAGPGYFATMGTRIVAGREFDATDRFGSPLVAVVNEEFVRRYLQGVDPLGTQLLSGSATLTIVGVAQDGKYVSLAEQPLPFVWRSADQWPPSLLTLVVRADGDTDGATLMAPIRQLVAQVEPDAAVTGIALASQHLAFALLPQRTGAWLLGLFGGLGLVLAATGVYGVMAYAVTQRTREFGIRLALGARPNDLLRMVLRQGMIVCTFGGVFGLILAAGTTRLMRFLLFDVTPLDPLTFGAVAALVVSVALVANWLPAHRAAKANPLESLRFD